MTLALKVGDVVLNIPSGWDVFEFQGVRYERIRGTWWDSSAWRTVGRT